MFATLAATAIPNVTVAPGVQMPMMAFGTARTSLTSCSVQSGVQQWLRLGGRHLDTADDYGTQPDVGRALKAAGVNRRDLFSTTKIPGPIGYHAAVEKIRGTALPQLGLDYIDLVLIHFPCKLFIEPCGGFQAAARSETWRGLQDLRRAGLVRAIGVSNFNAEQVNQIVKEFGEAPAVNQVQFHLAYHDEGLRGAMRSLNVTLEAWASLGGPTVHGHKPVIPLGDPRLREIALRYNVSTAQLALRWETQKGVVPVTATCSAAHAAGDLSSFALDISEEDMARLDAMAPQRMDDAVRRNRYY